MGKYCFGIDVGGTSVKCGLFQTDGVLVEKWEIPTHKENSGEAILPDIAKTILDKIAERKLDKSDVDGVGIGVLIKGTISSLITTQGTLSSWWVRIILSVLLCFFIVIQSVIASMKKKAK